MDVVPDTLAERVWPLFADSPQAAVWQRADDLWHYRRILSRANLDPAFPGGEITLVNWPQIDYWELPLVGAGPQVRAQALAGALVYIRESRRIHALFTVTEAHIGREMRGQQAGSAIFHDSVGIGNYRIDLHPSTSGRSYVDIDCFPFQIPLGALIPSDTGNLVAAGKNIGTTHITNGAYRLHPVEWSIGEAVGALADRVVATTLEPAQLRADPLQLHGLQDVLERLGFTLAWPEQIRTGGAVFDHIPLPLKEVQLAHGS